MFYTIIWNLLILSFISICIYIGIAGISNLMLKLSERVGVGSVEPSRINQGLLSALPFGVAAIVLGFLSGLSYEPAVSALVTGVVSLISGAAFIGFHKNTEVLMPVGIVVVVFALNLLAGATLGTELRDESHAKTENELAEEWLASSRIEFRVNNYRNNLGLSPVEIAGRQNERKEKDRL